MIGSPSIECIWPAETILGEAPAWCPKERVVYWVDIEGRTILRMDPRSADRQVFPQDYQFGCIVKRADGGFIAGTNAGLVHLDADLKSSKIFSTPEAEFPNNRFNDGKCDRRGRFWVGSTDMNETEPNGSLYRVNGWGDVLRMLPGVIVSNGLGWSPDDKIMYFTDSGHGVIYALDFDVDTGEVDNRREFARIAPVDGMPDGLAVDAEGFVWGAHWGGWRITRYDPEGRIDRIIDMPVPQVTSVAFGGDRLDQMFVTTARLGLTEDQLKEAPLSGGLFMIEAGVAGLPEVPYQGRVRPT
jgi:sugar lactone lactonase YvrE